MTTPVATLEHVSAHPSVNPYPDRNAYPHLSGLNLSQVFTFNCSAES